MKSSSTTTSRPEGRWQTMWRLSWQRRASYCNYRVVPRRGHSRLLTSWWSVGHSSCNTTWTLRLKMLAPPSLRDSTAPVLMMSLVSLTLDEFANVSTQFDCLQKLHVLLCYVSHVVACLCDDDISDRKIPTVSVDRWLALADMCAFTCFISGLQLK